MRLAVAALLCKIKGVAVFGFSYFHLPIIQA